MGVVLGPFYSCGTLRLGLMKWQNGELGSGVVFEFKPLSLVLSSAPGVPSRVSAGAAGRPVTVAGL